MKKFITVFLTLVFSLFLLPQMASADGGIYASGGGTKTVGETFTITVQARGAEFDTLQGTISVSGPVDVVSFSAGGATWMPGYSPANGKQFVGIVSATSSFTVATIKLKGKSTGSGAVSVAGVKMVRTVGGSPSIVGSGAGGASFTLQRALVVPGGVTVTSASHPDQNTAYEATSVILSWDKGSGVTDFAYLFDSVADTVPQAKSTGTVITITYADQAIGTYYFHIRAKNGDGWGTTTHFKVTIKEPDAKINDQLAKPSEIKVVKDASFVDDPALGTLSGIKISGKTEANFTANLILKPLPTLPEGKTLSTKADENGNFELLLDFPLTAGFYTLTIQGQDNKILTPLSDPISFEITLAKGGTINILTADDATEPVIVVPVKKWYQRLNYNLISYTLLPLFIISLTLNILLLVSNKNALKKMARQMKIQ